MAALPSAAVRWRLGGRKDDQFSRFSGLGGLDLAGDRIYAADAYRGAYLFDLDGGQVGLLRSASLGYITDVKAGPSGDGYVADAGLHQVMRIQGPMADPTLTFGGVGTEEGRFGSHSPIALAVSPDGEVYALDPNEDRSGNPCVRVQVFGADGDYRRSFPAEPGMDAMGMAIGPDGTLFVVSKQGYVAELEPEHGHLIQRCGEEALRGTWPQMVAIDGQGYLYVTTQIPTQVLVLGPHSHIEERIGGEGVRTGEGWPEGEFLSPLGVAVSRDGRLVVVGDTDDTFAYLTAFDRP